MATIKKQIYVDSGSIWIGDPCYLMGDMSKPCKVRQAIGNMSDDGMQLIAEPNREDLSKRSDISAEDKIKYGGMAMFTGEGMGLCIDSGGDGSYTCTIKTNEQNRVESITINLGG